MATSNSRSGRPGRPTTWTRRAVVGGLAALPVAAVAWSVDRALGGSAPKHTGSGGHDGPTSPGGASGHDTSGHGTRPGSPPRVSIAAENARTGTADWAVPQNPAAWDKVRGFASRTSVAPGEIFHLFVSTAAPSYTVTAYRMGHYAGLGGRQVWASGNLAGKVQAAPTTDRATNMREASWEPSVTITADKAWVPGSYLFKLVSSDGGASQIPLVVRDDDRDAVIHIQHDVTTWQAYNKWGGASLYEGDNGRSDVVSFDRPYDLSGSGNFLGGVYEICALVESLGYEVTYSTSLDTHARPADAKRYRAWVSPAHDEYWSLEMRNGVEAARDAGVNLMFLGANCMFRRIRLEPSPLGPYRHQVNYRIAANDPLNGKDPQRVTTSWREPPAARPESSIIGTFYESNPVKANMVIVAADAWMFDGTGVHDGDQWFDLVGNEYDRVTPEFPTPPTIQVLAHSPVVCRGHDSFSDMTYYTVPSGAGVFSSGSIWFERHLLPGATGTDAQTIGMVENILRAFTKGPAGRTHPSKPNLAALGIHAGYLPTEWGGTGAGSL